LKKLLRCLYIFLLFSACITKTTAEPNVLAIGDRAINSAPVDIPINDPGDLNFKTREEILNWRIQNLYKSPGLLSGEYVPNPAVFSQVVDGKPWWGMQGTFIWGVGKRSIEGLSEESRFVLNPLLLVGANPNCVNLWKPDQITPIDMSDPTFPYCWLPKSLRWYPDQSLVQVVYDVTEFNQRLEIRKDKLIAAPSDVNRFGLIAYNARDFGFDYLYLNTAKSINVTQDKPVSKAVQIQQMIHCGGSCGYPGGCNNMSPAMPDIDYFRFSALPARAHIDLWKQKPNSVNDKPDLIYYLDLR